MRKNIPPVRHWRVRYWMDKTMLAEVTVETINKRFAKWCARDHVLATKPERWMAANRVTVSLVQQ